MLGYGHLLVRSNAGKTTLPDQDRFAHAVVRGRERRSEQVNFEKITLMTLLLVKRRGRGMASLLILVVFHGLLLLMLLRPVCYKCKYNS
jgi:hypothetical protein